MFEFFEILPNPSLETLLIAGRAALLLGAFWIFALAFSRWRRADDERLRAPWTPPPRRPPMRRSLPA